MNYLIFSYLGLGFALIYRIPQIVKIIQTKSAEDLSNCSYLTHNAVYVNFIVYLVGTGKTRSEWVLCLYYVLGMAQNFLIYGLKHYYRSQATSTINNHQDAETEIDSVSEMEVAVAES